jgi:ubiquinol-cytochrome c reductase cytochrome b subunit
MGHPDNYIPANPLVTPPHIQPEWYFLFAYAILRSIPDKLLGVIALFSSLLVLFVLPHVHTCKIRSSQFRPIGRVLFWFFVGNFFLLTYIGAMPVEDPWVLIGQLSSVFYFAYFLVLNPIAGIIENKLIFGK